MRMARNRSYVLARDRRHFIAADSGNVIASVYSNRESKPAANRDSAFWKGIGAVTIESDYMGEPMPRYRTEVRSRWTRNNLYLLFVCPYEEFWLKRKLTSEGDQRTLER